MLPPMWYHDAETISQYASSLIVEVLGTHESNEEEDKFISSNIYTYTLQSNVKDLNLDFFGVVSLALACGFWRRLKITT